MDMNDDLVSEYLVAKAELIRAQGVHDDLAARLMKQMEADQRKSYRWTVDGRVKALFMPSSTPQTTRDHFANTHSVGICYSCHQLMDWIGFAFAHAAS